MNDSEIRTLITKIQKKQKRLADRINRDAVELRNLNREKWAIQRECPHTELKSRTSVAERRTSQQICKVCDAQVNS